MDFDSLAAARIKAAEVRQMLRTMTPEEREAHKEKKKEEKREKARLRYQALKESKAELERLKMPPAPKPKWEEIPTIERAEPFVDTLSEIKEEKPPSEPKEEPEESKELEPPPEPPKESTKEPPEEPEPQEEPEPEPKKEPEPEPKKEEPKRRKRRVVVEIDDSDEEPIISIPAKTKEHTFKFPARRTYERFSPAEVATGSFAFYIP